MKKGKTIDLSTMVLVILIINTFKKKHHTLGCCLRLLLDLKRLASFCMNPIGIFAHIQNVTDFPPSFCDVPFSNYPNSGQSIAIEFDFYVPQINCIQQYFQIHG